jgi:C_GCAxxG_C_C family probable redox protein
LFCDIIAVSENIRRKVMEHVTKARELFESGYNCSQAVFGAFSDLTGLDIDTAMKLSSSFGGGMGRLREVCGAVSGMFMVLGMLYGYSDPDDKEAKSEHYKRIQALAGEFKQIHGSIVCRELLDEKTAGSGYVPDDRQVDAARKSRANSRGNSKYAYIAPPKTGLNASYSENPLSVLQRMRPLASYSSATSRFELCHIRILLAI